MRAGTSRWERWARPRVLIAVVVVVLLTTVGLIVLYSLLLGRMSKQVEEAQSRSANLSNADREVLIHGKLPLLAKPFESKIKTAIEEEGRKVFRA